MRANYGKALRSWLKTKCIEEITDFGDLPVFKNATTYPCILRVSNNPPHNRPWVTNVETLEFGSLDEYVKTNRNQLNQTKFDVGGWSLADQNSQIILDKLCINSVPLGKYVQENIYYGIKTGLNEAFVISNEVRNKIIIEDPKSEKLIKPFTIGRELKRYKIISPKQFLILIPKGWTNTNKIGHAWKWFESTYPSIFKHLITFEQRASKRSDKGEYWWELRACEYYSEFEKSKIIYPNICKKPEFTFDGNGLYTNQKCFIISKNDKYLLGFLNSSIMMFFFKTTIPKLRGDFYEPGYVFMKNFPVHKIDFTNPKEVEQHDRMIALVERMLELHKRDPQTPQEAARIQREIAATDAAIDKLVYELYGLTEEEVKIVEGEK
jgi:hypothetical protein